MFHGAHPCPGADMKCAPALAAAVPWLPLPHPCCAYLELQGPPEQAWTVSFATGSRPSAGRNAQIHSSTL